MADVTHPGPRDGPGPARTVLGVVLRWGAMTTAPVSVPLVARTVPIPDPGPILGQLPRTGPLAWVRRRRGARRLGRDADASARRGVDRFAEAEAAWLDLVDHAVVRDEVGLPGTGPVAFGSFAFAAGSAAGGVLVVPEVVVGRRGDRWWLTTTSLGRRRAERGPARDGDRARPLATAR